MGHMARGYHSEVTRQGAARGEVTMSTIGSWASCDTVSRAIVGVAYLQSD